MSGHEHNKSSKGIWAHLVGDTMESVVLEKEAMKLSALERALLADRLLQTLDDDHEASIKAWTEVAEHRLNKFRSGEMDALDCKKFIESLKTKS